MLEDRNSIFFAGFVLGAIFSYSGVMGFFGGCLTGIIVVKNYDKIVRPENRTENSKQETKSDWIDIENEQVVQTTQTISPLENIKTIFSNYIKSGKN